MKRRNFLKSSALASLAFSTSPSMALNSNNIVTASDLQNYLRSLYMVREPSVDRIIAGDPGTKIKKVGTAWMPYFSTLKNAVEKGVNVMVVHEPTFYTHWDLDGTNDDFYKAPEPARSQYLEAVEQKKKWIVDNELTIIRCHDVLDIIKDFGIPFGLGMALGLKNENIILSKNYYNVYRIQENKASEIVENIAVSLREFSQPGVAFYGDPNRLVKSIGLGTGCICDPLDCAELEADLHIAIDDTIRTWVHTTYAEDTGNPLVVINHGTSEEMGVRLLNAFLSNNIPEIPFIHFNQGCSYKWIT
ncbi:MAG: Nif3-like dinuclear metal center hexameric protein [Prolixibacteraceae bacterium]|nr:Nif3-like dinuclear metal center hexameric protein [Prolixibacteraceae bacterium]